jgi:LysR family transcriptional regulator for metE and metH
MLDRQHLTIIREVNRTGRVTAAAENLNMSQSAVSHAIAKLEKRHGVKVWRKKGRGLELTQAGRYLLELSQRLVPELEHAERTLADFSHGRRGTLRIGMECHPCEKWLMQVTGPFIEDWPDVDIEVSTAFRFDGIAALLTHEIDVLVTPDPVIDRRLEFHAVFGYELLVAVREDHWLAMKPAITPNDLVEETLFTVPVSQDRLDVFSRFLIPAACRPFKHIGVETTDLMLQLVAAGRGVTVLPDWLLRNDAADLPIRTLRIGEVGLFKHINLGLRVEDSGTDYLSGLIALGKMVRPGN